MRAVLIIAAIVLTCSGCANLDPPHYDSDTTANSSANYRYHGDLSRDGGTDCFYYCF